MNQRENPVIGQATGDHGAFPDATDDSKSEPCGKSNERDLEQKMKTIEKSLMVLLGNTSERHLISLGVCTICWSLANYGFPIYGV